jgi:hypothetical protein
MEVAADVEAPPGCGAWVDTVARPAPINPDVNTVTPVHHT